MRSCLPSPNRFLMVLFVITLAVMLQSAAVSAGGPALADVLEEAAETTPELREEREQIEDLEREIKQLKARAGWQLMTTGSYTRGQREETIDLPAGFNGDNGNNGEPDENFDQNPDNDNNDLESFDELRLGLSAERTFLSGLELEGDISYFDDDPIDTDDPGDNITFSLEGRYQLWPRVPAEAERRLEQLEDQLELARSGLEEAREDFYLEITGDYLEIALLQEELDLTGSRLDLSRTRLKRAEDRRKIGEAGELEIRELELAVKQLENAVSSLERSLSSARDSLQDKLGAAPEPAYSLDDPLWQQLQNSFAGLAEELKSDRTPEDELLEMMKAASLERERLERELARTRRERDWFAEELAPRVDFSAGSPDLAGREWQASVSVSYALYQSGLEELEDDEFRADIASLEADLEELESGLSSRLKGLIDSASRSEEELSSADLEAERSALELEKEELALERGAADRLDIEELSLDSREARLERQEAEYRLLLDRIELVSSLDQLLFEEVINGD